MRVISSAALLCLIGAWVSQAGPNRSALVTRAAVISNVQVSQITATGAVISWTTSVPATSQVEYGTTTAYGLATSVDDQAVTAHTVVLSGLASGTLYHFRVISKTASGARSRSGDFTFATLSPPLVLPPPDTAPPQISAVVAGSVTSTSATISWATNEASSSRIEYGATTAYGAAVQDGSLVTAHYGVLAGLAPATLYHFRVISQDQAGNVAASPDYTFATAPPPDTAPPVISNLSAGTPAASAVTISWTTNESATTQVEYGLTTAYGSKSALDSSMVTNHAVSLTGLQAGTTYHFRVLSSDAAGNAAFSPDAVFTTAAPAPPPAASVVTYSSPYCDEGKPGPLPEHSWACGPWPAAAPPPIPAVGQTTKDPDTGNRVLRVTGPASYSQTGTASFFTNYGGWHHDWAADDSALIVRSWGGDGGKFWVGFDPVTMTLTGKSGRIPDNFSGDMFAFDETNPDLIVGVWSGAIRTWSRSTGAITDLFALSAVKSPFTMTAKGNRICVANGPQDSGVLIECFDRATKATKVINVAQQTIDGRPYTISYRGGTTSHPGAGIHAIMLGADGAWLSVDTHGTPQCTAAGLGNYSIQSQVIDLTNDRVYSWSLACGQTHWAFGYSGVMIHGAAAAWTPAGFMQPGSCSNDDDRGVVMRTASDPDATLKSLYCPPAPATYGLGTHFSWQNNANDANRNQYPIVGASWRSSLSNRFLFNDVFAVEVAQGQNTNKVWRFAQTWNDQKSANCDFLGWTSPVVSRSGRYAAFPSNWMGQTGAGSCTYGKRVDVFVFELK